MTENSTMEQCSDHKDCSKKTMDNCLAIASIKSDLKHTDDFVNQIGAEIYEGPQSIKSRVKGLEVAMTDIKDTVLENRDLVGKKIDEYSTDINEKLKGMFKLFCIFVSAATVVLVIAFGIVWGELKSHEKQVVQVEQNVRK